MLSLSPSRVVPRISDGFARSLMSSLPRDRLTSSLRRITARTRWRAAEPAAAATAARASTRAAAPAAAQHLTAAPPALRASGARRRSRRARSLASKARRRGSRRRRHRSERRRAPKARRRPRRRRLRRAAARGAGRGCAGGETAAATRRWRGSTRRGSPRPTSIRVSRVCMSIVSTYSAARGDAGDAPRQQLDHLVADLRLAGERGDRVRLEVRGDEFVLLE